jgi:hypothetical protein
MMERVERFDWWGAAGVGTVLASPVAAHFVRFPFLGKLAVFAVAVFAVAGADAARNPNGLGAQFLKAWWNPDFWNMALSLIFLLG